MRGKGLHCFELHRILPTFVLYRIFLLPELTLHIYQAHLLFNEVIHFSP